MALDGEEKRMLAEVHSQVAVIGSSLSALKHKLEGNGRPGLFEEFASVKLAHERCQQEKKEAKAEAIARGDASLKKAVAFATIVGTLVSAIANVIIQYWRP